MPTVSNLNYTGNATAIRVLQVVSRTSFNINSGSATQVFSGGPFVPTMFVLYSPSATVATGLTFTFGTNSPDYDDITAPSFAITWASDSCAIVSEINNGVPEGITSIYFNPSVSLGTSSTVTCDVIGYYI